MMRHDFGRKTSNGSVENFTRGTSVSLGPAYPSPILRDDSAIAGKWNGTSRHFAALRNFVAIGGIADMAGLAAGSTRSRMTQLRPGRMEGGGCSALPGRAGISNAFSAAYSNRDRPVDVEQRRHSGIGCIGRSFI
jgi:hypothetical protein